MRNLVFAAIALACLAGAGPAQAQYYFYRDGGPTWRIWREETRVVRCDLVERMPGFNSIDYNEDGLITGWEFSRTDLGWNAYHQMDLDKNGFVSRSEVRAVRRGCNT